MRILGFPAGVIQHRLEQIDPEFAALPQERKWKTLQFMAEHPEKALQILKEHFGIENVNLLPTAIQKGELPETLKKQAKEEPGLEEDPYFDYAIGALAEIPATAITFPAEVATKGLAKWGTNAGIKALKTWLNLSTTERIGEKLTEHGHPTLGLLTSLFGSIIIPETGRGLVKSLAGIKGDIKLTKALTSKAIKEDKIHSLFGILKKTAKSFKTAHKLRKGAKDLAYLDRLFSNMEMATTKHPELKPLYERELKRIASRSEDAFHLLYAKGKGVIDEWGNSLIKLKDNEKKLLSQLITISDRYPKFNKAYYEKGIGKVWRIPDEQLKAWNVPKNVIDAYKRIRRVSSKAQSYLTHFIAREHKTLGLSKEEALQLIKNINSKPGYYPRIRQEKAFWIIAKHKPTGRVIWRTPANSYNIEQKKQEVIREITHNLGQPKGIPVGRILHKPINAQNIEIAIEPVTEWPEGAIFERATAKSNVGALVRSLIEQGKVDPETAQAFLEQLNKTYMVRGFGRHLTHRAPHWIGGFDEDVTKTLDTFIRGLTGYTHKVTAARDFAKEMSKIAALQKPALYAYADQYVRKMLENQTKADKGFAWLRQLAYAYHLAGKPAFAVINATQNLITARPLLQIYAKRLGYKGSLGFRKAIADYAKVLAKKDISRLPKEEAEALIKAMHQELIGNPFVKEMLAAETGAAKIPRKVGEFISYPISISENLNRGSTFLAAFRIARKAGKSFDEAYNIASELTRKAHFQYGKANLPHWASTPLGNAWLTLRQYTLHLLNLWREMYHEKEYKALLESIAILGTLGGLESYPFIKFIKHHLRSDYGIDVDKELKEKGVPPKVITAINKGIPSALLGTDLSTSLTLDLPFSDVETAADALRDLASPGGVALWRMAEGFTDFIYANNEQDRLKAIEKMMPAFIRNPIKAYRGMEYGLTSRSNIPVWQISSQYGIQPYKYSKKNAIRRFLGFMPTSETVLYENLKHYRDMFRYSQQWRKDIYIALRSGKFGTAMQEIEKYNQWAMDNGFNPIDKRAILQAIRQMGIKGAELQYNYPY